MNLDGQYVIIDIKLIDDILTLKQIEHSIHAFEAEKFNVVIDNLLDNYQLDDEGKKIVSINPSAKFYIYQKINENTITIDEIITDELELNNTVYSKYDIINFDLDDVTCKGMILDFNTNGAFIYIETLIAIDHELSILNVPFDESSNIKHFSKVNRSIINELVEAIED